MQKLLDPPLPQVIAIVIALAKHTKLANKKNIPNQTNKLTPNNIFYSLLSLCSSRFAESQNSLGSKIFESFEI